jgi:hypothetical protein
LENQEIVGLLISGDVEVSISSGVRKTMIQIPTIHSLDVAPDLRIHKVFGFSKLEGIIKGLTDTHASVYLITKQD